MLDAVVQFAELAPVVGCADDVGDLVGAVEEPLSVVDGGVSVTWLDSVLLEDVCLRLLGYPVVENHGGLDLAEELLALDVVAAFLVYGDGELLLPLLGVCLDHVEVAAAGAEDGSHVGCVADEVEPREVGHVHGAAAEPVAENYRREGVDVELRDAAPEVGRVDVVPLLLEHLLLDEVAEDARRDELDARWRVVEAVEGAAEEVE